MKLKLLLLMPLAAFSQSPFYHLDNIGGVAFGRSAATYGNETIVSTSNTDIPIMDTFGGVGLFAIDGNTVSQTHAFFQNDGVADDDYGNSLAFYEDHIAISSPQHNSMGAVYTYRRTNGTWNFVQKLTEPDTPGVNYFGKVCLLGNYLFVGAFADEADGQPVDTDSGAIYVFHFDGQSWEFQQKLTVEGSHFLGADIKAEGNYLIAQGIGLDESRQFYAFSLNGDNWAFHSQSAPFPTGQSFDIVNGLVYTITHNNATQSVNKLDFQNGWTADNIVTISPTDQLFSGIKILGDRMFLGSSGYILLMTRKFPVLYYRKIGDDWLYQNTLYGQENSDDDDFFGSVLSGHGDNLIIGAPMEGNVFANGMAYRLDVTTLAKAEFTPETVSIYPNPAQNTVTVNAGASEISKIVLSDIGGRSIISSKETSIDVSGFDSGIYLLKVEFESGRSKTVKIVKD